MSYASELRKEQREFKNQIAKHGDVIGRTLHRYKGLFVSVFADFHTVHDLERLTPGTEVKLWGGEIVKVPQ